MWRQVLVSLMTTVFLFAPFGWGEEGSKLSSSTQTLIGLSVEPVKKGNLPTIVTALGKVEANPTLTGRVMSKASGRVVKIMAKLGDSVKANEPLALVDSREVGEARALFRQAQAKLQLATDNLEKSKRPEALALVTQAKLKMELEEKNLAQLKNPDARADVILAQTKLALAKANLERLNQPASQAAIAQAEAKMKFAKAELERKRKLFAEKIAAKKELESAETEYENARADHEYQKLLWQGEVQSAQAEVKSAEAELKYRQLLRQREIKKAQFALERAKSEYEYQKFLHQKEVKRAEAEVASEKIDVEFAKEKLRLLGVEPSDGKTSSLFTIRSPISGTIVSRRLNENELVKEGEELFEVMDFSSVVVMAEIYESDLPSISLKEKVLISFDIYPGKTFNGEVDYIAPQISPEARTVSARITLKNPDGFLKPGMFAHVEITTGIESNVLTVPKSAVLDENGKKIIFVKNPKGEFVKRMVEIGVAYNGRVEVEKGLKDGEMVVTKGAYQLKNISITAEQVGAEED